jgi:molecular chaperone HscB
MRPTLSSASRLCATCRLRAYRASAVSSSSPQAQHARRAFVALPFQQYRLFSQSPKTCAPQDPANDAAASPSSSAPPPSTHYDLFPETLPTGPPPHGHFPVDVRALRREFLQLQARAHPDLHPPELKARAEAASARINDAYRTLANPLLRAQYLLALRGVDVAADERLKVDEPALLMDVLEAREDIEDAASEDDLLPLRRANDARIADAEAVLDRAFAADDVEAAKREAVRLRYWVNIKDSLDNWEPGKPVVLEH